MAGKNRAGFFGVIANGDDDMEVVADELVDGLGAVPGNIDADLLHHGDGLGADQAGFRAGENTSKCSPASCRSSPSAIWLRAELPVHKNRTRLHSLI
jgi:hypothetical protein